MHQLFGYRPNDAEEKLSGIVLEVKGDLCRHDHIENATLSEIRKIMDLVYTHGQRFGLLPHSDRGNPIRLVRRPISMPRSPTQQGAKQS
jgi:hypothetical protein